MEPLLSRVASSATSQQQEEEETQELLQEIVQKNEKVPEIVQTNEEVSVIPNSPTDLLIQIPDQIQSTSLLCSKSIIIKTVIVLIIYLTIGIMVYYFFPNQYSGIQTNSVVDGLYYCMVTMCTIGYGDIAPITPQTKLFAIVFVLFGFCFVSVLLNKTVDHVLGIQEGLNISRTNSLSNLNHLTDVENQTKKIRIKIAIAIGVVLFCIGIGMLFLYFVEELNFVDSMYLTIMSVTTVGYGDIAFTTAFGRVFAAIWVLVSTIAVARAFLYLTEERINGWHLNVVNLDLNRVPASTVDQQASTREPGRINQEEADEVGR